MASVTSRSLDHNMKATLMIVLFTNQLIDGRSRCTKCVLF